MLVASVSGLVNTVAAALNGGVVLTAVMLAGLIGLVVAETAKGWWRRRSGTRDGKD